MTFPASTTSFNVTVSGTHSDYSVLYRDVATVQPVSISLNVAPYTPTSSGLTVKDPPGMDIFSVSGGDPGGTLLHQHPDDRRRGQPLRDKHAPHYEQPGRPLPDFRRECVAVSLRCDNRDAGHLGSVCLPPGPRTDNEAYFLSSLP